MPTVVTTKLSTLSCGICAIPFAIPEALHNALIDSGNSFYCPNGHHISYTESEANKLRKRLEREQNERARVAAERDQAQASARAQKGVATKARKRAAAALCPCCNRSFVQLRRHMASKHPDYDPTEEPNHVR